MPTTTLGYSSISAVPYAQPSMSPTNIIGRTTSLPRGSVSVDTCFMTKPQNSCFVSTFPRWKTGKAKHTPNLLSAFASPIVSMKQKAPSGKVVLRATGGSDGSNNLEPHPVSGDQQLVPFLMYAVIPFVPSVSLSTLNDDYQSTKETFNAASASLPANIATDSMEYLSLSSMYNESMQKLFVLLLSKRLALYFLATLATLYAGWRASTGVIAIRDGSFSGPGDALDKLNREIFQDNEGSEEEGKENNEDQLFATLIDDNPQSSNVGNALAVALPLVLTASLALSYLSVVSKAPSGDEYSGEIQEMLASSLPYLSSLPSAILCLLFMATEFRWALPYNGQGDADESTTKSPFLCPGNILALSYVIVAYAAKIFPTLTLNGLYLDLWPLQNGVNIALATGVTRGISPFLFSAPSSSSATQKSIRTIALALIGITMFDAISVFGTVANAATDAVVNSAEPSMSVMETVARSKLASPTGEYLWQPGLLSIILGHDNSKVTEALGLGDVVFPSILVSWAFAADNDATLSPANNVVASSDAAAATEKNGPFESYSGGYPYASAATIGYIFGSIETELVGSFGNISGLPALVFLVPSMLIAVTLMAWSRNELDDVWGGGRDDGSDFVGGGSDDDKTTDL
ncbi:hypothetical protein ACHAXR_010505 [Thalassiosira sp. AJA248-18]